MKTTTKTLLASLILSVAGHAALAATPEESRRERMDEAYDNYKSGQNPQPGKFERAENAVKRGAQRTGDAIKHGAEKTGQAIEHGAEKAGEGIKHGAQKTGEAIGKGIRKTGDALHRAGESVENKTRAQAQ